MLYNDKRTGPTLFTEAVYSWVYALKVTIGLGDNLLGTHILASLQCQSTRSAANKWTFKVYNIAVVYHTKERVNT